MKINIEIPTKLKTVADLIRLTKEKIDELTGDPGPGNVWLLRLVKFKQEKGRLRLAYEAGRVKRVVG